MFQRRQRRTFLSYSRVNGIFVLNLRVEIFSIWLDQMDIPLDVRWNVALESALEECETNMIIMIPVSIASVNVWGVIGYAIENGKRLMLVMMENCNIPLQLKRFQSVNLTTISFDEGVEFVKLLRGLITQNTNPRIEIPTVSHMVSSLLA